MSQLCTHKGIVPKQMPQWERNKLSNETTHNSDNATWLETLHSETQMCKVKTMQSSRHKWYKSDQVAVWSNCEPEQVHRCARERKVTTQHHEYAQCRNKSAATWNRGNKTICKQSLYMDAVIQVRATKSSQWRPLCSRQSATIKETTETKQWTAYMQLELHNETLKLTRTNTVTICSIPEDTTSKNQVHMYAVKQQCATRALEESSDTTMLKGSAIKWT